MEREENTLKRFFYIIKESKNRKEIVNLIRKQLIVSLKDILTDMEGNPSFFSLHSSSINLYAKHISLIKKNVPELESFLDQKDKNKNFALAYFWIENRQRIYLSISSELPTISKESKKFLKENEVTLVSGVEVENYAPVQRLHVEELKFYSPNKSNEGYASKKENCTERKIVARILKEIKDEDNIQNARLAIYTKLEPCIYCYNLLDSIRKKKNISIYLLYREMLLQIADELKGELDDPNKLYDALEYNRFNGNIIDMKPQGNKFKILVEDNSWVEFPNVSEKFWFDINKKIYNQLTLNKNVEILWDTEVDNKKGSFKITEKILFK